MSKWIISLLLLALASSPAAANTIDRNSAVQNFQDLCKAFGPFVPMMDVRHGDIRTEQFCFTSQLDSNQNKCALLDAMEAGLIKSFEPGGSSGCKPQTPGVDKSIAGTPLPFALSEQRPLPASLPSSLMDSEGGSYYWLWRNLHNFNQWAGCAATSTEHTVTPGPVKIGKDWLVPAGWTVHSTLWQPNGGGQFWPFATVISKGGEVAIFIRGSQTEQDWKADFDYSTITASLAPGIQFPGSVHKGFARVAASLWPGLTAALQDLSASAKITNVYVAGHSLGAGVSTLVSYGVQVYLDNNGIKAKVDALLFAPPNAGDATFAADFGSKVNARRMPFAHDIVPQVPCSPGMVSCKRAPIPTGGDKLWSYSAVPGTLMLLPSGMSQQSTAWSHFSKIFPCQMGKFFQATHVCSYNCFLSRFAKDGNTMCKLWDQGGEGTFCPGYPNADRPYPYILG